MEDLLNFGKVLFWLNIPRRIKVVDAVGVVVVVVFVVVSF